MKRIFSILFTAFCAIALTGASAEVAEAASVKNRQVRQQKRIGQGVRSGELTRPETRRLQRNATRIRRSTRRDRIDGGVFTPRERAQSQRKLNRQSRAIRRQKTDGQSR